MRLALVSALAAATFFGPPSITVTEVNGTPPTPGAVLAVATTHHTEEAEAQVSARAISMRNGQRVTREIALTKASGTGRYGVTKQWESGTPWLLVFTVKQGDHGDHGTAESLVKVDAAGKIVAIEKVMERNARGDVFPRAASEAEITRALAAMGAH
jgi:hypothetical protein